MLQVTRLVKENLPGLGKRDGHDPTTRWNVPEYLRIPAIGVVNVKDRVALVFRESHASILTVGNVLNLFIGLAQRVNRHQTAPGATKKAAGIFRINDGATRKNLPIRSNRNGDR